MSQRQLDISDLLNQGSHLYAPNPRHVVDKSSVLEAEGDVSVAESEHSHRPQIDANSQKLIGR